MEPSLLAHIKEHADRQALVIECNGGDDCFGFTALQLERKFRTKHLVPGSLKKWISGVRCSPSPGSRNTVATPILNYRF